MKDLKFRNLAANEISVRPTDTKFKGSATLLLYQDARVFMDILDETVGQFGWQKKYEEIKGNVYCAIGIKDNETGEWVWKSDCGAESKMEAEKGEASDAGKRAAVCWGIGRELYSGPVIKIKCPDNYYFNDRMTMTFNVKQITYDNKKIASIEIVDRFGNTVYTWSRDDKHTAQIQKNEAFGGLNDLKSFCSKQKQWIETDDRFSGLDRMSAMDELKKFYEHYAKIIQEKKYSKCDAEKYWSLWLNGVQGNIRKVLIS